MAKRQAGSTASGPSPNGSNAVTEVRSSKRQQSDLETAAGPNAARKGTPRRKNACQSCRPRKVKCDAALPTRGICKATNSTCHYINPSPQRLTYFNPGLYSAGRTNWL
ncbi:hypothetical protein LTR56_023929, partial [Elasticomyces elasticus]